MIHDWKYKRFDIFFNEYENHETCVYQQQEFTLLEGEMILGVKYSFGVFNYHLASF